MTEITISIAKDFSRTPAGRYRNDGPATAERFRDDILIPALKKHDLVMVDITGTAGMGSSFLEETFGGLVRKGFPMNTLEDRLLIVPASSQYAKQMWDYINSEYERQTND